MAKNSSRVWLERELRLFAASLPPGALVLDAGAGDHVYASLFAAHRYETADFEKVDKVYRPPTYSCDLAAIPVENNRFDAIVFTQVMEHLPEPLTVLREFNRILKPGGVIFYTGPLWYEEHEVPYDFYRYTRYGLNHLFGQAGFTIREMRGLDGYLGTVAHQLHLMKRLPWRPSDYGGGLQGWASAALFSVLKLFLSPLRKAAAASDSNHRYDQGMVINYLAILAKP